MTVGYLLDLLIINEIRKEKMGGDLDTDVKHDLDKQNGFYLREIGRYLLEISDGKRPGVMAKHKNYDKDIKEVPHTNFIEAIYSLYAKHSELWNLEDIRRDKNLPDKERLEAADRVSIVNKKRNDLVEQIDNIINNNLKKTKLWGELVE